MVSTHLKNTSQIGSCPQVGVKIRNIWYHQLVTAQFVTLGGKNALPKAPWPSSSSTRHWFTLNKLHQYVVPSDSTETLKKKETKQTEKGGKNIPSPLKRFVYLNKNHPILYSPHLLGNSWECVPAGIFWAQKKVDKIATEFLSICCPGPIVHALMHSWGKRSDTSDVNDMTWRTDPQRSNMNWLGAEPSTLLLISLVVEPTHLKNISQNGNFPQFSGWT